MKESKKRMSMAEKMKLLSKKDETNRVGQNFTPAFTASVISPAVSTRVNADKSYNNHHQKVYSHSFNKSTIDNQKDAKSMCHTDKRFAQEFNK